MSGQVRCSPEKVLHGKQQLNRLSENDRTAQLDSRMDIAVGDKGVEGQEWPSQMV